MYSCPDGDADSGVDETETAQPEPESRERREEAGAGARQRAATSRIPRCVPAIVSRYCCVLRWLLDRTQDVHKPRLTFISNDCLIGKLPPTPLWRRLPVLGPPPRRRRGGCRAANLFQSQTSHFPSPRRQSLSSRKVSSRVSYILDGQWLKYLNKWIFIT